MSSGYPYGVDETRKMVIPAEPYSDYAVVVSMPSLEVVSGSSSD